MGGYEYCRISSGYECQEWEESGRAKVEANSMSVAGLLATTFLSGRKDGGLRRCEGKVRINSQTDGMRDLCQKQGVFGRISSGDPRGM